MRLTDDVLVGDTSSDAIHRYTLAGAALGNLASIDTFVEQISEANNGNLLAANFAGSQEGVIELTSLGSLVDIYDPPELGCTEASTSFRMETF